MENWTHGAGKRTEEETDKLTGEEDSATHRELPYPVYAHNVPHSQAVSLQIIPVTAIVTPPENPPSSYLAFSTCSSLCCLPLALCAITFSRKSLSAARRGDYVSARKHGETAFGFAVTAIVTGIIATSLVFGLRFGKTK